jgi:LysR family hydrogen peroxide-inducible transcriptional activator
LVIVRPAPLPVTLRQLQYLVAVVDQHTFRKAAELCGVSQPALSAQIATLEEALDVQLLERDRRSVRLTPAGKLVLERARRLLVGAEDLADVARHLSDPLSGEVRIGIIPTISPYVLPEIVPALRRQAPRLTLYWVEERTDTLVRKIEGGELDAAFLALEARLGELQQEVLARDPFVLAMSPMHPLAARSAPARLDELVGQDLLLLDDGHCLREQALAACKRSEAHELDFRATSLTTLVQMVAAGTGITLLPRLALPVETRHTRLALRRFAPPVPERTLGLVWRKGSPATPALRLIAGTIRAALAKAEPRLEKSLP